MKLTDLIKNVFVQDERGPLTGDTTIRLYCERIDRPNGGRPYVKGWILSDAE